MIGKIILAILAPSFGWACDHGLYVDVSWLKSVPSSERIARIAARPRYKDLYFQIQTPEVLPSTTARRALEVFQKSAPETRRQGWVGFRICPSATRKPCLNLAQESDRNRILQTAQSIWNAGFEGFHLDAEPIQTGDPHYLELLTQLQKAKPPGKLLSIAAVPLQLQGEIRNRVHPKPLLEVKPYEWDEAYYEKILPRVDQVMVMNYDTAIRKPEEYADFTEWQARKLTQLCAKAGIELRMGVPVYTFGRRGAFFKTAENLKSAHLGLKKAWEGQRSCPSRTGIAIFIEREFSLEDRRFFDQEWK